MLESMEGRRAMPRLKPPFPSKVGYLGRPTLIANVETLAHLPAILRLGGEAWAAMGRNGAPGVRLWSVTGAVQRPGCYEAPNGIVLRELIDEHAWGLVGEPGAIVPGGFASGTSVTGATASRATRTGGTALVRAGRTSTAPIAPLQIACRAAADFPTRSCSAAGTKTTCRCRCTSPHR